MFHVSMPICVHKYRVPLPTKVTNIQSTYQCLFQSILIYTSKLFDRESFGKFLLIRSLMKIIFSRGRLHSREGGETHVLEQQNTCKNMINMYRSLISSHVPCFSSKCYSPITFLLHQLQIASMATHVYILTVQEDRERCLCRRKQLRTSI